MERLFGSRPDFFDRQRPLLSRLCGPLFLAVLMFFCIPTPIPAASGDGPWSFSIGYTYYSGLEKVRSTYKKNAAAAGKSDDIVQWSFGFTVQAHRRISENLRIGAGIGPVMTLLNDANHIQVPASVSVITTIFPNWTHSPYVRVGGSYHMANGDYLTYSRPGLLAGLGIEFYAQKSLHLSLEAAYDDASVTIERPYKATSREIRVGALVLSLSAVF